MRFMFIVKATGYSEAGVNCSQEHNAAMIAYRKSLASAGVLISAEELHPSSTGIRITYPIDSGKPELLVGPFPVDQELIAEYILIEVNSEVEALDWALQIPVRISRGKCKIEVRKLKEDQGFIRDIGTLVMETNLEDQLNMLKKF